MTWFFLLITVLFLFDVGVFWAVCSAVIRNSGSLRPDQRRQPVTEERFRMLVILTIVNVVFVLGLHSLVWIPAGSSWLKPRIDGDHPAWVMVPLIWMLGGRSLWELVIKVVGLIGLRFQMNHRED